MLGKIIALPPQGNRDNKKKEFQRMDQYCQENV